MLLSDNGFRIYVDIKDGGSCRQLTLLTGTSFVGRFVHPVGWGGMGLRELIGEGRIVILAIYKFHFITY